MSEFAVHTERLRGCASQLTGVEGQLEDICARLRMVQLGCILQIRASSTMITHLQNCADAVSRQSDDFGRLSDGINAVALLYDTYERRLLEPSSGTVGNSSSAGDTENASGSWLSELGFWTGEIADALLQILGGNSVVFGLLSALFDFGEGEHWNGLQSIFGGLANVFDTIGEAVGGEGTVDWFADVFGFNASNIDDFGDAWSHWLDDMGLGSNPGNGASVVCRWAGYALSFVIEGFDNYGEYGGDMGARFWSETILEGAVDVGVGVGVGLLAAALLPASWPAIAVGAVGGLVVWGVDSVCEWLTGGDFSDLIVDPILDTAEVVIDGVVDVAQNVGRTIADGAEAVCNWFGSLF